MPRKPTFKIRMEEWIEDCSDRMLRRTTLRSYESGMKMAWRFGAGNDWPTDPRKIQPMHIRDYLDHLEDTYRPGTQRQYISVLMEFLRWSGNTNLERININIQPARNVEWHTPEEIGLLINSAPNLRVRAMVVILAYTAIRVGGLSRLRYSDVEPTRITVFEKGRKERRIPIDRDFWEEIQGYLIERQMIVEKWGDHPAFLIHRPNSSTARSSPYSTSWIYQAVKAVGRSVGLDTYPHKIRRTTLREMYFLGCPPAQLQKWAGHATWEQTQDYIGINDSDLANAILYRPDYLNKGKTYLPSPIQINSRG